MHLAINCTRIGRKLPFGVSSITCFHQQPMYAKASFIFSGLPGWTPFASDLHILHKALSVLHFSWESSLYTPVRHAKRIGIGICMVHWTMWTVDLESNIPTLPGSNHLHFLHTMEGCSQSTVNMAQKVVTPPRRLPFGCRATFEPPRSWCPRWRSAVTVGTVEAKCRNHLAETNQIPIIYN